MAMLRVGLEDQRQQQPKATRSKQGWQGFTKGMMTRMKSSYSPLSGDAVKNLTKRSGNFICSPS